MNQKTFLQNILGALARKTIARYTPVIIGITGSVGKTSTREAIFTVLKKKYRVRTAEKNYNNEIGIPLTILGIPHYGRNILAWLSVFVRIAVNVYLRKRERYPEVLILEYAIDRPGDMDYLISIAKPSITVVSAIGDIPVHVEFFGGPEELIAEKAKLVEALPHDGYAILNHDDYAVLDMKGRTKARVFTYGTEEHATLRITNYMFQTVRSDKSGDIPDGTAFKISYEGDVIPIRLHNTFGMSHSYAAAAAIAVGITFRMNLIEISDALREYVSPPGRLRLLHGIKNSFILDDTYNAAPESMRVALDTLKSIPGKRKIAVLGDMLEIGKYAEQAHRAIGDQAAEFVDLLLTVGPRAKFIADEVLIRGIEAHPRRLEINQVFRFDDSITAGKALDSMIQEGDLILVKGSQDLQMERVVLEIMAEPQRAHELLVRQDEYWKNRP